MKYAFKMMAVVLALGVLVLSGLSVASANIRDEFIKVIDINQIDNKNVNALIKTFIKKNKSHLLAKEAKYILGQREKLL